MTLSLDYLAGFAELTAAGCPAADAEKIMAPEFANWARDLGMTPCACYIQHCDEGFRTPGISWNPACLAPALAA